MKRAIRALLVFTLIGAAVNVAVAWGCALWVPFNGAPTKRQANLKSPPRCVQHMIPKDWVVWTRPAGSIEWFEMTASGIGVEASVIVGIEKPRNSPMPAISVRRAGWPLLAVECHRESDDLWRSAGSRWRGGLVAPAYLHGISRKEIAWTLEPLPLRPIWSGFVLDALLYAAPCWVLFGGPRSIRQHRRRRGGLCLACGYPTAGLDKCPECGAEATRTASGLIIEPAPAAEP